MNHLQQEKNHTLKISYEGPLPPATELQKYEQIQPGFADRIVKLAENETAFRHKITEKSLEYDYKYKFRGQLFAGFLGTLGIVAGAVCTLMGAQTAGAVIGGSTVLGIVSVFILGRKYSQES